jgi:iron complex transport system ATP-binding protein
MSPLLSTISVNSIELGYIQGKPLIPTFSVDAFQGELVGLIGRNGIGKSTLMRSIIGLQKPLSGNILVSGNTIDSLARKQRAKLISYVPAEPVRVPNLFIRDFVAVARFPYLGWSRSLSEHDWEAVDNSLAQVGIMHLSNRDITTVSDGERQRAMIAFALAQDTKIILLDEPTAFLDLPNKFEMVHLLSQLAHLRNKTIIYSTHDLQGAMGEADIIWMMLEKGFVAAAPEQLALENRFTDLLSNTKVVLDTETGMFKNYRKSVLQISVDGSGVEQVWTPRLLERLGYSIVSRSESKYCIICQHIDNSLSWELFVNNNLVAKLNSLTDLARMLREKIL